LNVSLVLGADDYTLENQVGRRGLRCDRLRANRLSKSNWKKKQNRGGRNCDSHEAELLLDHDQKSLDWQEIANYSAFLSFYRASTIIIALALPIGEFAFY
jgi:hypothetical protein